MNYSDAKSLTLFCEQLRKTMLLERTDLYYQIKILYLTPCLLFPKGKEMRETTEVLYDCASTNLNKTNSQKLIKY